MPVKQHKRADTYEGPQMTFKFPSAEDLQKSKILEQAEIKLEGPPVTPYYQYEQAKSPTIPRAPLQRQVRSRETNHFNHPNSVSTAFSISSSKNYASSGNAYTSSEASIPTQSNATTRITCSSESLYTSSPRFHNSPTLERRRSQISAMSRASSIHRTTSVAQRRQLANTALRSGSLKRSSSKSTQIPRNISEDQSLYEKGSVKRSKAVRYTVGWLTRLKQMGSKMSKRLKKWRLVSLRKVFKFNRVSTIKVKKNKISMPLERGRAQSISELRMAIDDWNEPHDAAVFSKIPPAPKQKYATLSASSASVVDSVSRGVPMMGPPIPPPHRIASNKSMQRLIEREQRRASGRTLSSSSQPALRAPMDQNYERYTQSYIQTVEPYPSQPPTVYDDEDTTVNMAVCELEEDLSDDDDGTIFEQYDDEQEAMLREYWKHYLRSIVASRIETKLEIHRLSQIPEPEKQEEYAHEVFGSLSDLDDTSSQFSNADNDSLTSASSTEISEGSSLGSEHSTNYFSAYDGPVATPLDVMKYQLAYMARYRDVCGVQRASTLPLKGDKETRHSTFESKGARHMRFLSVAN
ncbi:CYFA0S09e00628g1_1 [Cyberlindnera fabianii]|uniref:CYFA0S09e00628g1_1 n=1 Tax=Cyberlindnera fabianii TaxID=36022 RepID=A0A061B3P3_CYBFA|nr:CYFA0S09e00628g1_1 [Cyberlindnera fabianii]